VAENRRVIEEFNGEQLAPRQPILVVGRDSVEPPCQGAAVSKPPTAIWRSPFLDNGKRERLPYNLLAQAWIEMEPTGVFNFDSTKILMFRIEEKRSFSRHNHTRNGKNHGMTQANPIVANLL
jgi:hypothetical protein